MSAAPRQRAHNAARAAEIGECQVCTRTLGTAAVDVVYLVKPNGSADVIGVMLPGGFAGAECLAPKVATAWANSIEAEMVLCETLVDADPTHSAAAPQAAPQGAHA